MIYLFQKEYSIECLTTLTILPSNKSHFKIFNYLTTSCLFTTEKSSWVTFWYWLWSQELYGEIFSLNLIKVEFILIVNIVFTIISSIVPIMNDGFVLLLFTMSYIHGGKSCTCQSESICFVYKKFWFGLYVNFVLSTISSKSINLLNFGSFKQRRSHRIFITIW